LPRSRNRVDALSATCHRGDAEHRERAVCRRLKERSSRTHARLRLCRL